MKTRRHVPFILALIAASVAGAPSVRAQIAVARTDFTALNIDQLMQIKINSVSRKDESLFDAAAAIFVISEEDVRRSGATSIGECLRMSPGMHAARIDDASLAVAARGFNDVSSNKLLVMIDGRAVYSPLFSGVHWNHHHIVMEDLDRIEVIRGPGASMWGANAVNGVVNVSTKSAKDTVGSFVSVLMGDYLEQQFAGRHGADLGDGRYFRIYAKHIRQATVDSGTGMDAGSSSLEMDMAGIRYDVEGGDRGRWTVQAELTGIDNEEIVAVHSLLPPFHYFADGSTDDLGAFLLGRYTRNVWGDGEFSIQGFYDYSKMDSIVLRQKQHTADLDVQMRRHLGMRHEIVAGAGLRWYGDDLAETYRYRCSPTSESRVQVSGFVQDEFAVVPDELHLTVGAKLEKTGQQGAEFQPNVRLLWRAAENQSLWASVARAARTPSRAERSARISMGVVPPNPLSPVPTEIVWQTSPEFRSEGLVAFEAGHRISFGGSLSLDTALFFNRYSSLRSVHDGGIGFEMTPVPHAVYSNYVGNAIRGSTCGAELAVNWQPAEFLRLQGTVSLLDLDLEVQPGVATELSLGQMAGSSPKSQSGLRAMVNLTREWQLDVIAHHTASMPYFGIDAYTALDLRLAWSPRPGLELSVLWRDLLEARHPEFPTTFIGGETRQIPRSFHAKLNWGF